MPGRGRGRATPKAMKWYKVVTRDHQSGEERGWQFECSHIDVARSIVKRHMAPAVSVQLFRRSAGKAWKEVQL